MIEIIGTAHISQKSVDEVEERIRTSNPAVVAVELDLARMDGLLDQKEIPVVDLIKSNNSFIALMNIMLSFFQRKMGNDVGVKPGKEMLRGMEVAKELGIQTALIDRDIQITLKRTLSKMSFFEKLRIIKELIFSFFSEPEDLTKEVEEVKKEENLEEIIMSMKSFSPNVYKTLVDERDAYMAHKIIQLEKEFGNVLVVIGAGHKKGVNNYLRHPETLPSMDELIKLPPKKMGIGTVIKYGLPGLIVGLFILAFIKGVDLQSSMGIWILNNMIPTFLGVVIARGSIQAAVAGTLASPLTSLNPMMAAGWVAGYVEARVRKVKVGEVSDLFKTKTSDELYKNRAFKVLLVTAMANLGSMIGTFVSIPTVVIPLFQKILG